MATLDDNAEGLVRVGGNELIIDAKNLDAAAIRLGAPQDQGGIGKISFDSLEGSRKEMVLMIGAHSPGEGGEFSLNLLEPGGGSTDDAMAKVLEVSHEVGFRFNLPISAPNLGGGGGGSVNILGSPNGRMLLAAQDDLNLVLYIDGVPVKARFGLNPDQIW